MRWGHCLGLLLAALPGLALAAEPAPSWPQQIADDLIRLGHVEWRLRLAAEGRCPQSASSAGFVIDYIGAYDEGDQPYVRQQTGLGELPQVLSVEAGGPAETSGIRAGDQILAVSGEEMHRILAGLDDPSLLADAVQDRIAGLNPGAALDIALIRNGREFTVRLMPRTVCSARFMLKTEDSIGAHSDGINIAINTGTIRFTANDDELALVAGHELAHVVAFEGPPARLFGRRKIEDEADLMGARLAHCAGYAVGRSLGFWKRYAQRESGRSLTHRSARKRLARLTAATGNLSCE
ncbi:MAG: PDZ domain-containing protein [Sphingomonadaceae bacterium]|nr:PDZ domain-containing protein [Sphingomonadaceae bacterium]